MNKRHNRGQRADLRKFQSIHAGENRNSGHIPMKMALGLAMLDTFYGTAT